MRVGVDSFLLPSSFLHVQGTNGYMGKCPCFKSKLDHTLYLATNSCDSPQKEVPAGACVPMQDYEPWNLLCALPKNPKAAAAEAEAERL